MNTRLFIGYGKFQRTLVGGPAPTCMLERIIFLNLGKHIKINRRKEMTNKGEDKNGKMCLIFGTLSFLLQCKQNGRQRFSPF